MENNNTSLIRSVGILGTGSYLPDKILTNFDLQKMVDTSDEWIVKRTGISERRIIENGRPYYEMGARAAERALESTGINASEIDLIIVTTNTQDYFVPSTASMIQNEINAVHAATFDLNAACTGFVYGMTVASQFISSGYYKYVLVISCEALSRITDWEDRSTCVLFGDGAGAAVLGPVEEGTGLLGTYLGSDGSFGHLITSPCTFATKEDLEKRLHENKRVLWLDGGEVFKFAVKIMETATFKVLEKAKLTLNDIDLIIPHQANIRIIDSAIKRLGISSENVFTNLHRYGNISSASIPVALDEAVKENRIKKGNIVLFVGFGAGLTWGSALIKWSK